MRAHPADYNLVSPGSLPEILALLARQPRAWLPIAGGTDLMVQYSAGKLAERNLVSIWNLPELRRIDISATEVQIGAGCTYTTLRENEIVAREFSLLSQAAGWTGGIANQNRGTLGGNIANASPAADSLPALLAYDAELILVSARGERRIPYAAFHLDYRKTQMTPDELIRAVCLRRNLLEYRAYGRKVGPRNAQAIAKICVAALAHVVDGVVQDIRIAMGSIAPVPLRLTQTESVINGKRIDASLVRSARAAAAAEVRPIDDIRSTERYRRAVAGNLVAEFLESLSTPQRESSEMLARWNALPFDEAAQELLPCCGSIAWARGMCAARPIPNESALLSASDRVWNNLPESDWMEAFRNHPRIGDPAAPKSHSPRSAEWSRSEQRSAFTNDEEIAALLADGNRAYEQRFHRIFIVCATGKTAKEILQILQRRLANDEATELREAAEQQRQITHIRLKKWLAT